MSFKSTNLFFQPLHVITASLLKIILSKNCFICDQAAAWIWLKDLFLALLLAATLISALANDGSNYGRSNCRESRHVSPSWPSHFPQHLRWKAMRISCSAALMKRSAAPLPGWCSTQETLLERKAQSQPKLLQQRRAPIPKNEDPGEKKVNRKSGDVLTVNAISVNAYLLMGR